MYRYYIRGLGFVAALVLGLSLTGCGKSNKNNGYSYAPPTHATVQSTRSISAT